MHCVHDGSRSRLCAFLFDRYLPRRQTLDNATRSEDERAVLFTRRGLYYYRKCGRLAKRAHHIGLSDILSLCRGPRSAEREGRGYLVAPEALSMWQDGGGSYSEDLLKEA